MSTTAKATTHQKDASRRWAAAAVIGAILLLSGVGLHGQSYTLAPAPFQYVLNTSGAIVPNGCVWTYAAGTTTAIATYADTSGTLNGNPIVADSFGRFVAYLLPGTNYKFQYEATPCSGPSTHGSTIKTQDNIQGVPASAANVDIVGTAGVALTAGQCAYLSDGSGALSAGQWYKCDSGNTYSSSTPIVGIPIANIAIGTSGTFRISGYVTGLTSLTVGAPYYAGSAGALTSTGPTNKRFLGVPDTTSTLIFAGNPRPLPATAGSIGQVLTSTGATTDPTFQVIGFVNDFRLSLTTATCVTASDVTGASAVTIYWTPCSGNRVSVFDTSGNVETCSSAELSIAVPNTTSTMYDVWVYDNVFGTCAMTLEVLAWTNDTTRATATTRTAGRYVKSGNSSRLYVGSFRTTTVSGQTEDSFTKRYVWNMYNRVNRPLKRFESTATWNYSTGTIRQANGAAANQLDVVIGQQEDAIDVFVHESWSNTTIGAWAWVGVGEDSTTAVSANCTYNMAHANVANYRVTLIARLTVIPAVGRHTYVWLEQTSGDATGTFQGVTANQTQAGIWGSWRA